MIAAEFFFNQCRSNNDKPKTGLVQIDISNNKIDTVSKIRYLYFDEKDSARCYSQNNGMIAAYTGRNEEIYPFYRKHIVHSNLEPGVKGSIVFSFCDFAKFEFIPKSFSTYKILNSVEDIKLDTIISIHNISEITDNNIYIVEKRNDTLWYMYGVRKSRIYK